MQAWQGRRGLASPGAAVSAWIGVTVITVGGESTSFAVSLSSDRKADGGGYRITTAVLGSAEHRKQMLADALDDLERVREKYASLKELAKVFDAIKDVRKRLRTATRAIQEAL